MQPQYTIPLGFCQCGCGQKTAIIPETHPGRGLVKGQPHRFLKGHWARCNRIPRESKTLEQRFWEKVNKTATCWLWQASPDDRGYGHLQFAYTDGKQTMQAAHRIAWILTNGPIPDGMFVCHKCDNPPCVRPDHLFLGTSLDNAADMAAKGRSLKGTRNPKAKLTADDVIAIRKARIEDRALLKELAAQYNVTLSTINAIMRRANWDWL